jgi:hypothetical protein
LRGLCQLEKEVVETRVILQQMGQQEVANTIAGVAEMEIGRVPHGLDTTLGESLVNFPSTYPK